MKKILVIHQWFETSLADLYNNFGSNFNIKIICPQRLNHWLWFWSGIFDKKRYLEFKNIDIIPINLINYKNPLLRTLYGGWLYKIIKSFKPDIIHCYTEIFSPTLAQILFLRSIINKNIKVLNYSWETIDWTRKFPHSLFWRYSAKKIDIAICANDHAMKEVNRFGVSDSKIKKIYRGVDFSNFHYIKHSIECKKQFKIWFIWRLLKDKWLINLIEAIKYLWINYSLDLIWEWTDKAYLQQLSKDLYISDRVNFIGKVSYNQLPDYIEKFDLFVLPSISKSYREEQFGRVLVEMMASWVPVIWSSSGAIPEVIGDRWLIFEAWNSNDLAKKIQLLSEDEKLYSEFVIKAYEFALDNFSQNVFRMGLEKMYMSL